LTFILRQKEHTAWLSDQKTMLARQHEEKCLLKACKKRLQTIDRTIYKNNDWLRRQ